MQEPPGSREHHMSSRLFVSVKMEAVEVAGFKCDAVCEQRGGETVAEQDDS